MGRNKKRKVDYFPHYKRGDTMEWIRRQFGNDGYATWFILLEELADENDHFIELDDKRKKMLSAQCDVPPEKLVQIIDELAEWDKIDDKLWKEKNVIYSETFRGSILHAYRNRNHAPPNREELRNRFFDEEKHFFDSENVVNASSIEKATVKSKNYPVVDVRNRQIKEKKIKGKDKEQQEPSEESGDSSSGADALPGNLDRVPRRLKEWQKKVNQSDNPQGLLGTMIREQFPDNPDPNFARLGKLVKKNDPALIAEKIWKSNGNIDGNVLDYITKATNMEDGNDLTVPWNQGSDQSQDPEDYLSDRQPS